MGVASVAHEIQQRGRNDRDGSRQTKAPLRCLKQVVNSQIGVFVGRVFRFTAKNWKTCLQDGLVVKYCRSIHVLVRRKSEYIVSERLVQR